MQEILKVTDVNFERSDFSLNNISFKLYSGDIVGLIGENGAGKTTLFNVIFKNLEPSNGEISFLGDQHTKTDKSEMAIILDKKVHPRKNQKTRSLHEVERILHPFVT